ncbi:hypothetical protein [uncultured Kordia sp.]|uniref:hypothetical protein n=1 Tax=uncultured Kordia sp. TaxID=507699 RepID=UPI002625E755|nr:hypothetical protein [uncultured Kordia sp.]
MKLSTTQIEQLYKFTRDHYVEHYDLQTELVDHLANGIEKRWENNPKLSFEDALNAEFKEFGIFGFSDIIEKHTSAISKRYLKIIFRFMREYIKLPKIIGTLCAVSLLFYFIRYVSFSEWVIGFAYFGFFLYLTILTFKEKRKYNTKAKKTGKRWKLEEMIYNTGYGWFSVLNLFQIMYHLDVLISDNYIVQMLTAMILVFVMLFTYISVNVLPEKAEELLREAYPEYELSV